MKITNDMLDLIHQKCDEYEKEELDILKKFSSINCNTRNEEGIQKVVDLIQDVFDKMNVETEQIKVPGYGTHLVAKVCAQNPTGRIILSAHTDTAFDDGDVEIHPYHEEGNLAYGLGIGDCKGGLVVSLYALRVLKENGLLPNKNITVIYNCDEEIGSLSGREIYEREAPGAEAAYVFERGRRGGGPITSRRGLTEAKMETYGISNHAARYNLASSAIEELCYKIIDMKARNDYANNMFYSVGPVTSGTSHINKVPDYASCELCTLLNREDDYEKVESFLKSLEQFNHIEGCKTKVTMRFLYPPMEWTAENSRVAQTYIDAGKLLGYELKEQGDQSVGDASYFTHYGVPTCDGLGAMSVNSHTYDECLEIDSVKKRTELFAVTMAGLE